MYPTLDSQDLLLSLQEAAGRDFEISIAAAEKFNRRGRLSRLLPFWSWGKAVVPSRQILADRVAGWAEMQNLTQQELGCVLQDLEQLQVDFEPWNTVNSLMLYGASLRCVTDRPSQKILNRPRLRAGGIPYGGTCGNKMRFAAAGSSPSPAAGGVKSFSSPKNTDVRFSPRALKAD